MNSLKYLNKYLVKYKWRLIIGVLCIIVSNVFGVMMPKVVGDAINSFKDGLSGHVDANQIFKGVFKLSALYVILDIAKGFFLFLTRQTIIIASRHIEYDLKNEIYNHYQNLDFSFYKKNRIGDLMNRISEDVTQVRQYLGPGIMYNINLLVLFPLCIFWMMQTNVKLTLLVLLPLPLLSFIIYKVSSKINFASKRVQEQQSWISNITQENFSGIRILKAFLQEEKSIEKFNEVAEEYKKRTMKRVLIDALFLPSVTFLIALSVLLAVYVGGLMTYSNEVGVGDIVAFVMYIQMLTWPFASVGWVTSLIQRAAASQTRINEFLEAKPVVFNQSEKPFTTIRQIRFDKVSYTYQNSGITALKELSFEIKQGEKIGIIGKTGSGKSTILQLLTRQFDPEKGDVYVNDAKLPEINLSDYRKNFGVVPQEVFLFSDTIENNISFGVNNREISFDEIKDVARQAGVLENILEFPDQFKTVLGERGVNLSGGQKQRISIARALIRKPQVLLLDDCLSAVDTETEEEILSSLHLLNEQTIVIVSHRISSLRFVDRILVLDNGTIAESGTQKELLENKGIFYKMYQEQMKEAMDTSTDI